MPMLWCRSSSVGLRQWGGCHKVCWLLRHEARQQLLRHELRGAAPWLDAKPCLLL